MLIIFAIARLEKRKWLQSLEIAKLNHQMIGNQIYPCVPGRGPGLVQLQFLTYNGSTCNEFGYNELISQHQIIDNVER